MRKCRPLQPINYRLFQNISFLARDTVAVTLIKVLSDHLELISWFRLILLLLNDDTSYSSMISVWIFTLEWMSNYPR